MLRIPIPYNPYSNGTFSKIPKLKYKLYIFEIQYHKSLTARNIKMKQQL